jgi:hypothetical protein
MQWNVKVGLTFERDDERGGPGLTRPESFPELRTRLKNKVRLSRFHRGPQRIRLQQAWIC